MSTNDTLRVEIEWLDDVEATPAEMRTTWAAMSITVGDQALTQIRHRSTGSSRRTIHVSTYPLALWVASNWWRLSEDERPFDAPEGEWSFLKPRQAWQPSEVRNLLVAHNLRAAGGGMPLPDATLVPHGALMRIRWFAGYTPGFERVQFLTSGAAWLDRESTLDSLASLVDETLSRLNEAGVSETALHEEWAAVQLSNSDADTRPYCVAVARLGMDPYDPEITLEAELQAAEDLLPPATLDELTHAVAVCEFADAVAWLGRALAHQAAAAARPLLHIGLPANGTEPWLAGYSFAERYRAAIASESEVFPVLDYVTTSTLTGGTHSVEASVAVTDERVTAVVSRESTEHGKRFLAARAILLGEVNSQALVTRSSSWLQQASRAFAAELLAPAELLRDLLSEQRSPSSEEIEQLAERFRVSPMLVEHQIENRLLRRAAL